MSYIIIAAMEINSASEMLLIGMARIEDERQVGWGYYMSYIIIAVMLINTASQMLLIG